MRSRWRFRAPARGDRSRSPVLPRRSAVAGRGVRSCPVPDPTRRSTGPGLRRRSPKRRSPVRRPVSRRRRTTREPLSRGRQRDVLLGEDRRTSAGLPRGAISVVHRVRSRSRDRRGSRRPASATWGSEPGATRRRRGGADPPVFAGGHTNALADCLRGRQRWSVAVPAVAGSPATARRGGDRSLAPRRTSRGGRARLPATLRPRVRGAPPWRVARPGLRRRGREPGRSTTPGSRPPRSRPRCRSGG
jgi:hypothetical protein